MIIMVLILDGGTTHHTFNINIEGTEHFYATFGKWIDNDEYINDLYFSWKTYFFKINSPLSLLHSC